MEKSGFFADIEGDRGYTDDFLAEWVASFIENGVYNTELGVMAAGDMNITVQPGRAWINGRIYILTEALTIPVEVSDGKLNRYTSIVLRADANARKITVQAVDGTYSAQPTAPNITRNSEIYELKLADIYVAAGAISISQAEITDTRLDNEVCGLVYCPVEHIDTESLYNQIQTDLTNFRNISQKEFDAWFSAFISSANGNISEYENSFLVWFEHMKDQLSEDAAGNLQTQVDNLNNAALGGGLVMKGNPISIEAAGANRIDSLTLYGENAQGGTTEAPVALTGVDSVHVCGRNLLPLPYSQVSETKNGLNIAVNADGTITVSGTATAETYLNLKPIPASLYRLMGVTGIVPAYDYPVTKNGFTFFDLTIQPHVEFALVYIVITKGSVVNRTYRPYIIKSAEPLPYETYQGSVTPIPIPRPLRRVGDVKDKCVTRQKHEGAEKLVVTYNVGYIASYAGESITTAWISSTGALSTGAEVAYVLSSPEVYATDPVDFDNAAGPLTVMTGGELEVRMTELVGSRSPELAGKMDKATYDADGDGVVDRAGSVDGGTY